MRCYSLALFALALAARAVAAETPTALDAVKLLPPAKAARLAWIEGRDGDPQPARWYLIVQDEFDENGLHEYVVAGNEIVASRDVSQFVTSLKPEDVLGVGSIKVDSSNAARLASRYAAANGIKFSTLNFRLKKVGEDQVEQPVWKVTCMDESGNNVGELSLDAVTASVLSHDGFARVPDSSEQPERSASVKKKRHIIVVQAAQPLPPIAAPPEAVAVPVTQSPTPTPQTTSNRGFFQRVGGSFTHIFGSH